MLGGTPFGIQKWRVIWDSIIVEFFGIQKWRAIWDSILVEFFGIQKWRKIWDPLSIQFLESKDQPDFGHIAQPDYFIHSFSSFSGMSDSENIRVIVKSVGIPKVRIEVNGN